MELALVFFSAALVVLVLRGFLGSTDEEDELAGASDSLLEQIAEYRTYIVNQWISLLVFWLGVDPNEAQTKLTAPAPNQNTVYFFYEDLEVYAYFDWVKQYMVVKTSIYDGEDGYITNEASFTIAGRDLPTKDLFAFIHKAKLEHAKCVEISAEEVMAIALQVKGIARDFTSKDAAQTFLFNQMTDFILLMRKKKNRNNRKLLKFYTGILYWFWSEYRDEFTKFLNEDEEATAVQKQNNEKTSGNE